MWVIFIFLLKMFSHILPHFAKADLQARLARSKLTAQQVGRLEGDSKSPGAITLPLAEAQVLGGGSCELCSMLRQHGVGRLSVGVSLGLW